MTAALAADRVLAVAAASQHPHGWPRLSVFATA
jgi:hypothetical protein